jgi:GT2 family glycosyltransferase
MLFDENFFMYKEDIDLSYRMRWQNLKMDFLPDVLGYHHRTVSKSKKKSQFEAKQSYNNHLILLRNNFTLKMPFSFVYQTIIYEFLKALYYLFKNPKVLKQFKSAFKIKLHKSKKTIPPVKVSKYFLK